MAGDEGAAASPRGLVHGQVCYLQIPAADVAASARFYAEAFGWQLDPEESGFEAPGLIGQWVTDRPPAAEAGFLPWIWVDDIDLTLERAVGAGATIREPPLPDGPRWLATMTDPAGNLIGLAQHGARRRAR